MDFFKYGYIERQNLLDSLIKENKAPWIEV